MRSLVQMVMESEDYERRVGRLTERGRMESQQGRPRTVMTGKVFDALTVVNSYAGNSGGRALYLCECSCGRTVKVPGTELRRGRVRSCGCLRGIKR